MKFDFVIGNPPYQENDGGAQASAKPVYHFFVKEGQKIGRVVSMIMPSRWMTGGKGLDSFRQEMISDKHFSSLHDYTNSKDCFGNVEIKGGVCTVLWNENYDGPCKCFLHDNNKIDESLRFLQEDGEDIYIRNPIFIKIIQKVKLRNEQSFSTLVSSRKPYGLTADSINSPQKYSLPNMSDVEIKNGYKILGLGDRQRRCWKYIPCDYPIPKTDNALMKYKIFMAEAYGSGELGEVASEPILGKPGELCTETFLQIGIFDKSMEALNIINYIKTKFFRALISIKKQTQHTTQKVYKYIPIQDFTSNSDIDWSKSIKEIDQQLYRKYKLSKEEIDFIEQHVKEMN